MKTALLLICVQAVLGAFDNLWHHELEAQLPQKRSARFELLLHTARELAYAFLFFALAWYAWHGLWALLIIGIMAFEIAVTLTDFVVEDLTRRLPKLERILHTVMAIGIGVVIALMTPTLLDWYAQPSAIVSADYGLYSWLLSVFSVGVLAWGLRDLVATVRHYRPPEWRRAPLKIEHSALGRTVLVTGATGFIGRHLVRALLADGNRVIVHARNRDKAFDRFGPNVTIVTQLDELTADTELDGVINLAGAPILGFPWTAGRRRRLVQSRVQMTRDIVALCARLNATPEVLINASAIGYYGLHADNALDEAAPSQDIFQSELCQAWEHEAQQAEALGVRTVRVRIGLVLGRDGGALPALARPVRLGLGAVLGTGAQYVSWIHVDDLVRLLLFALTNQRATGALNGVAPEPVTQRVFQAALAEQLNRKIRLRAPAWPVRVVLGDMAQLVVDGQRVVPAKADSLKFLWLHPTLGSALADLLVPAPTPNRQCTEIVFDGSCPVCNTEVQRVRRQVENNGGATTFTDIDAHPEAMTGYGLALPTARQRIYAVDHDGNIRSGFAADILLWESVTGPTLLTRLLRLPGIFHLGDLSYDLIIAPALAAYARRRRER